MSNELSVTGNNARLAAEETGKKLSDMQAEIASVYASAEVHNRAALLEKAEAAKALAYQIDSKEKEVFRLQESIAAMEKTLAAMPKQEMPYCFPLPVQAGECSKTMRNAAECLKIMLKELQNESEKTGNHRGRNGTEYKKSTGQSPESI